MSSASEISLRQLKEVNPQAFAAWVELLIDDCEDRFMCTEPNHVVAIVRDYADYNVMGSIEEFIWCPELISTRSDVASGYGWLDANDVPGDSDDDVEQIRDVPTMSVEQIDTSNRNLTLPNRTKL